MHFALGLEAQQLFGIADDRLLRLFVGALPALGSELAQRGRFFPCADVARDEMLEAIGT